MEPTDCLSYRYIPVFTYSDQYDMNNIVSKYLTSNFFSKHLFLTKLSLSIKIFTMFTFIRVNFVKSDPDRLSWVESGFFLRVVSGFS